MTKTQRIHLPSDRHSADGNIRPGHPAERAFWIWSPSRGDKETACLRFGLDFEWAGGYPLRLHVSADQRFQLYLNGEPLSFGPDRSDPQHWAVATLECELPTGQHRLEALVWYIAEDPRASRMDPKHADGDLSSVNPPMAQMSHRAGFLLAGDSDLAADVLDTGRAPWRCADLTAAFEMSGPQNLGYHDIGPQFAFDLSLWREHARVEQETAVVGRPPVFNIHGVRSPGWALRSTDLPEQLRERVGGGRIRAVRPWLEDNAPWQDGAGADVAGWQELVDGKASLRVPEDSAVEVLWDLDRYLCGYPDLIWSGGAGATLEFSWSETLFIPAENGILDVDTPRGHRGEVDGKVWLGYGDAYKPSGSEDEAAPALWWRSGRYLRLRVRTGGEALELKHVGILTTGYPLERAWQWSSSDSEWDAVMPLLARGMELGAHETWADSPFYEQMMYVGDNLMHALSNYVGYEDIRLTRRTLELLDWSRAGSLGGLIAERYPAGWRQESATYAMLFPLMLRNHLMWRGDFECLQARVPGMRQLIESLLALRGKDGLLKTVPGWPFVDWVGIWDQGCGPGVREGDSSIVNLHLVLALRAAAEIERALGESCLASRYESLASELMAKILERYWCNRDQVLRDTVGKAATSEHAHALALLSGLLEPEVAAACLRVLTQGRAEAKATIYFSYYILEALAAAGASDAFHGRLKFWRGLPGMGFTALPEMPDPCRSDCHGWGAHPFYHTYASIAGIRPAAPGFEQVCIRPMPAHLESFDLTMVHPKGALRMRYAAASDDFQVDLPAGVGGVLHWGGRVLPLDSLNSAG